MTGRMSSASAAFRERRFYSPLRPCASKGTAMDAVRTLFETQLIFTSFLTAAWVSLFGVKRQAATAAMKSDGPTVRYSAAYPFGVAGSIVFLYVLSALIKPNIVRPSPRLIETAGIALR
jgi:surface polysaccharide O-acyltransferase-like enzyme